MPGDAFYRSRAWLGVRASVLKRDGYRCATPGCRTKANTVDHIVARARGGAALDPTNLRSLCARCHSRKTARGDGGFGNPRGAAAIRSVGCDVDGWPFADGDGGAQSLGGMGAGPCRATARSAAKLGPGGE